jgi:hypothetical protein
MQLSADAIYRAVLAGDDTLDKLAETFDVPWSSFTLRRIVNELQDAGRVRLSDDAPGQDDYRISATTPTLPEGARP